jgi:hypothetical protein
MSQEDEVIRQAVKRAVMDELRLRLEAKARLEKKRTRLTYLVLFAAGWAVYTAIFGGPLAVAAIFMSVSVVRWAWNSSVLHSLLVAPLVALDVIRKEFRSRDGA